MLPSGPDLLFATMQASRDPRAPGLVICLSWGWELSHYADSAHRLADALAERGGAAMVLHWPGHGDSTGTPDEATMPRLAQAAGDALRAARDWLPEARWGLAGIRLGAAVAALTAAETDAAFLAMIQPELDPVRFFEESREAARRVSLIREGAPRWWFGQELPDRVVRSAHEVDVSEAIDSYPGPCLVVRYEQPAPPDPLPGRECVFPGSWRDPSGRGALIEKAAQCLDAV